MRRQETIADRNGKNKSAADIESIAMKGFELLCGHIIGYNTERLYFTLQFGICCIL